MSIPPVLRSLAAVGAIAAFCFTPVKSLAGEQNPLVVVGSPVLSNPEISPGLRPNADTRQRRSQYLGAER